MSKMKIFALLLTICLTVSVLASCNGDSDITTGDGTTDQVETSDTETTESNTETTESNTESTESATETTESDTETTESDTETTENDTETTESDTETTESNTETTESNTETTESNTETTENDTEESTEPPHTHDFGEWNVTQAPTCTEKGQQERSCSCGEKETEKIDALGHDEENHDAKAPTCTAIGWDAYVTCSRCNYTTYAEKAALGHKPGADATCTEPQNCSVCGEKLTSENGHVPGKAATCSDPQTCMVCGETLKAALGHDKVNHDAKAPTCTDTGWDAYETCSRCNYTTYAEKAALGHDKVNHDAKAPTCTDIGWDAYETCSRCNYTTYAEKTALGHDKVNHDAKAPTCTDTGWDAYETCSRCNYTTYEEKAALGHDKVSHDAKAPTCTDIGWDAYETCSRCNYSTQVQLPTTGHIYNSENTCTTCKDYKDKGVVFTLSGNKYVVTDYTGNATELIIPSTYKGLHVTGIGDYAFENCTTLTSVKLSDGITSIGEGAFLACRNLESIDIPDSVTMIEDYAFLDCYELSSVSYEGNKADWEKIVIGSDNSYLTNATFTYGREDDEDADDDSWNAGFLPV